MGKGVHHCPVRSSPMFEVLLFCKYRRDLKVLGGHCAIPIPEASMVSSMFTPLSEKACKTPVRFHCKPASPSGD